MAEAGVKGYEVAGWYGVVGPAKLPRPIVTKLNQEIVRALRMPDVAEKMAADGSEPVGTTPEQFGTHIKAEVAKWRDLIQKSGIRAD
jgi:tripartite-type tricarboxylate transporter receptor subunit TctC